MKTTHHTLGLHALLPFAILASIVGCTSATIRTTDGYEMERTIIGADASRLRLAPDGPGPDTIAREEIWEIDHPGNVMAILGASAGLGYTLMFVSMGMETCDDGFFSGCDPADDEEKPGQFLMYQSFSVAMAAPLLGYGLYAWLDSKRRAGEDSAPLVMGFAITGGAVALAGTAGLIYGTVDGEPELGTAGMTTSLMGIGGIALGSATVLGALLASGDAPPVAVVPVAGAEMTGAMAAFAW